MFCPRCNNPDFSDHVLVDGCSGGVLTVLERREVLHLLSFAGCSGLLGQASVAVKNIERTGAPMLARRRKSWVSFSGVTVQSNDRLKRLRRYVLRRPEIGHDWTMDGRPPSRWCAITPKRESRRGNSSYFRFRIRLLHTHIHSPSHWQPAYPAR